MEAKERRIEDLEDQVDFMHLRIFLLYEGVVDERFSLAIMVKCKPRVLIAIYPTFF